MFCYGSQRSKQNSIISTLSSFVYKVLFLKRYILGILLLRHVLLFLRNNVDVNLGMSWFFCFVGVVGLLLKVLWVLHLLGLLGLLGLLWGFGTFVVFLRFGRGTRKNGIFLKIVFFRFHSTKHYLIELTLSQLSSRFSIN